MRCSACATPGPSRPRLALAIPCCCRLHAVCAIAILSVCGCQIGDLIVPYNESFRLFITTKLPNPHYPPEVCVKVSLLNFTITATGLRDQMLGVFVVTELPEMEERKHSLTFASARMKKELQVRRWQGGLTCACHLGASCCVDKLLRPGSALAEG